MPILEELSGGQEFNWGNGDADDTEDEDEGASASSSTRRKRVSVDVHHMHCLGHVKLISDCDLRKLRCLVSHHHCCHCH